MASCLYWYSEHLHLGGALQSVMLLIRSMCCTSYSSISQCSKRRSWM